MGAGASVNVERPSSIPIKQVHLKGLPDAIDEVVNVLERWPLILDPEDLAARFLRYQRGPFLMYEKQEDMHPEALRRALVGALKNGSTLTLSCLSLDGINLASIFYETSFPEAVIRPGEIFQESVWTPLLRPEVDPEPHEFVPRHEFVLCVLTKAEHIQTEMLRYFAPVRVSETKGGQHMPEGETNDDDVVADAFGAKEVRRNSSKLVEAAFDGDLAEVRSWLDKDYYVDSVDGRKNTALSEAACQGHNEVIKCLLQQGADPNALNDTGRSPLFRAAFNGHLDAVKHLLEAGADQDHRDKSSFEGPFDVAKTDEVRDVLQGWDRALTTRLKEERKQEMLRKLEERIKTASDREAYARHVIRQELLETARNGDAEGVKTQLCELAAEAEKNNEKPRGSAEVRDDRGMSLLALAAEHNHVELAKLLLTHWKDCDKDRFDLPQGALSVEARVFKANANSRDLKGWNCCAIAVFHRSRDVLCLLLENGGDPMARSSYHKSAWDLAQDELDAAERVVKDNSEIRSVLLEWESSSPDAAARVGLRVLPPEEVPKEGTPTMLAVEFAQEGAGPTGAGTHGKSEKKKGHGSKGPAGGKAKKEGGKKTGGKG